MSFAAIERSLECYALTASNGSVDDFLDHERAYDRAAVLQVVSEETAARFKTLHTHNRSATYYRETVATENQAKSMLTLARRSHDHVRNLGQMSHEC